jgi:salicylate hydroxylase
MSASILIAGGGIGGLAAALGAIGAGIQHGSNAIHGFDTLGIGAAAHAMAVHIDQLRLMNAMSGEEIARVPLDGPFRRRIGDPYAVVHLGELHGVLLRACHENDLIESRTSAQVTAYAQDGCSVTATLASVERVSGTALIGADGLWSNIPQKVVGDGLPRVSCGGVGLASHGVATDGATAKAA